MRRKKEIQGNFKVFDHKWSDTDALMRRKDYVRHSWGWGEVQGWKKALGINAFLPNFDFDVQSSSNFLS